MISVFIQTLNEELNLPSCLKSLEWSDDVVVLDSFSSDATLEIARAAGARIYQRNYDGRAANQNWAVENIKFKYDWVYYSDADEIVPSDLRKELLDAVATAGQEVAAFRLRYKNFFMGSWIRRSSMYPTWVIRLFRPSRIRWERKANPVANVDGQVRGLHCHFEHYSFNKGMREWYQKHIRYAEFEAAETVKSLEASEPFLRDAFLGSGSTRRQGLKRLSFRLPGRPFLKFAYMYVLRRGFLDGVAGLHYCLLQSFYEHMIVMFIREGASGRDECADEHFAR